MAEVSSRTTALNFFVGRPLQRIIVPVLVRFGTWSVSSITRQRTDVTTWRGVSEDRGITDAMLVVVVILFVGCFFFLIMSNIMVLKTKHSIMKRKHNVGKNIDKKEIFRMKCSCSGL